MKNILRLIVLIFCLNIVFGQTQKLPVLKTNVNTLSIKDNNKLLKDYWDVNLNYNPDIYRASKLNSTVTFYSNIDSISFEIEKGKKYNFWFY